MATRRRFLGWCCSAPLLPVPAATASGLKKGSDVLASPSLVLAGTFKQVHEGHAVCRYGVSDHTFNASRLPGRGHDCVFSPSGHQLVVFARRPGRWFAVFNRSASPSEIKIRANAGRHFFGHGRFSNDGRLFYASENDYENAAGMVGIYDAYDAYKRLGEYPSAGIGPHDLAMISDTNAMIVANGGIETHPDFGREKLNLASMESSLVYVDSRSGEILKKYTLPASLQRLSIRHLAVAKNGDCFFAAQYQGAPEDSPPLVGCCRRQGAFELWDSALASQRLRNYITSIAVDPSGTIVATTSAKGGVIVFWDAVMGKIISTHPLDDCSGVAASSTQIYATSSSGMSIFSLRGKLVNSHTWPSDVVAAWDNHLAITPN